MNKYEDKTLKISLGTLFGGIIGFSLAFVISQVNPFNFFPILLLIFCTYIGLIIGFFVEKRDQKNRINLKEVPALFEAAQKLSMKANNLFKKGNYNKALENYQESLDHFKRARIKTAGLNDKKLIRNIKSNIITCEENIENCNIALDKEKVERLYKESRVILKQASKKRMKGELFKARDTLKMSNQKADDAFAISNRRGFKKANRNLATLLEQIRDEFNAIDTAMTSGVKRTTFKEKPVLSTENLKKDIEIKTGSEEFRGYIRFRVRISNNQSSIIANVILKLIADEKFLYVSHVEPDFPLRFNEVTIGTINSGEAKTVAFYLDPQMCSTSKVHAHITFMDSKGRFGSATSTVKEIGGKCPIFFTRDQANTAKLKNLVERQLNKRDRKVYFIPSGLAPREAFQICKEAIEGRDIQHVRDVIIKERPFEAIAWYYGQTKKTKENIVIAGIIRDDTNSIEIFVATTDMQKLTWLLAELGRDLNKKLKGKGIVQVQQVNVTIRDSIIQRSKLSFGKDGVSRVDISDSVVQRSRIGSSKDMVRWED